MPGGNPQKILIVRLSSIGDIVLTTPVVRALRRRFPSAQIHYLVKAAYAGLLGGSPHLDQVLALPDNADVVALRRLIRTLREQGYDLLVDLHRSWRSAILRHSRMAPASLVYRKQVIRRALYVISKNERYALASVSGRYFEAVAPLGVVDDGVGTELHCSPFLQRRTADRLRRWGWTGGPTVGLVPGAGFFTKRWPPERFVELALGLRNAFSWQVFVLGGEGDGPVATQIVDAVGTGALNLAGRLSLMESVAALSCCELVVANDTGLMHVADALGKNLVAVFGSTTSGLGFFPHGSKSKVVEADVKCRPCSHLGRNRCPKGHFRCMREISVSQVQGAIEELYRSSDLVPSS